MLSQPQVSVYLHHDSSFETGITFSINHPSELKKVDVECY